MKIFLSLFIFLSVLSLAEPAQAGVLRKPANNLGLVGYWNFNEGTSTEAGDVSGNGGTGSFVGEPTWVDGKLGKALFFDGVDDYVTVANSTVLEQSPLFTVEGWYKTTDTSGGILKRGVFNDSGTRDGYKITIGNNGNSSGGLSARIAHGTSWQSIVDSTATNDGRWHHFAFTYDGLTSTLYRDGVSVGTLTGSYSQYTGTMTVGRDLGSIYHNQGYLAGTVDNVHIYSRALSAAEVVSLYQSGAARVTAPNNLGLVGYWNFNEGTSTHAGDASGARNTGTITGATWTSGKLGSALSFDGIDDEVAIPKTAALNPSFPLTISVWVNRTAGSGVVFANNANNGGNYRGVILVTSSSAVTLRYGDGGGSGSGDRRDKTASIALQTNQWYHIVGVIRGATDMDIYVNGVDVGGSYAGGGGAINYSGGEVLIGSSGSINNHNPVNGLIDEVRLYNRGLSASDVRSLYQTGQARLNASSATLTQGTPLQSGLMAHWTFDGADMNWTSSTAGTATDKSGNGNTGTLTNMSQRTSPTIGETGQGLLFDGSDDYINMGGVLGITGSKSVAVWVKTSVSSGGLQYRPIAGKGYLGDLTGYGLYIDTVSGFPAFQVRQGASTSDAAGVSSISDGTWHHLVGVRDHENNNTILYVDGQLIAEDQGDVFTAHSDSSEFGIGRRDNTSGTFPSGGSVGTFDGVIDDVRVYNRVLSAAEVTQLYLLSR